MNVAGFSIQILVGYDTLHTHGSYRAVNPLLQHLASMMHEQFAATAANYQDIDALFRELSSEAVPNENQPPCLPAHQSSANAQVLGLGLTLSPSGANGFFGRMVCDCMRRK